MCLPLISELSFAPDVTTPFAEQEPRQLLEAFAQAEEGNLFLIQAAQEAEEGLEAARAALAAAKRRLGDEAVGLRAQACPRAGRPSS